MTIMHRFLFILLTMLVGCTFDGSGLPFNEGDSQTVPAEIEFSTISPSSPLLETPFNEQETSAILHVANTASFETLDNNISLDRRAAENIVIYRWGEDGVELTSDDENYESISELDSIKYVGPFAIGKILNYAYDQGLIE